MNTAGEVFLTEVKVHLPETITSQTASKSDQRLLGNLASKLAKIPFCQFCEAQISETTRISAWLGSVLKTRWLDLTNKPSSKRIGPVVARESAVKVGIKSSSYLLYLAILAKYIVFIDILSSSSSFFRANLCPSTPPRVFDQLTWNFQDRSRLGRGSAVWIFGDSSLATVARQPIFLRNGHFSAFAMHLLLQFPADFLQIDKLGQEQNKKVQCRFWGQNLQYFCC